MWVLPTKLLQDLVECHILGQRRLWVDSHSDDSQYPLATSKLPRTAFATNPQSGDCLVLSWSGVFSHLSMTAMAHMLLTALAT